MNFLLAVPEKTPGKYEKHDSGYLLALLTENCQSRIFKNKISQVSLSENFHKRFLIKPTGKFKNMILGLFLAL